MASWPETAPRTVAPSSSGGCSRAGGGSPSERPAGGRRHALRRELRLRRRKDFDNVFRRGRAWSNGLLVLRSVASELPHNRYGFVTSKRVGKAVVRNRVRRRLKEAVRSLVVVEPRDIVISAKAPAAQAGYQELKRSVEDLLGRAGLLQDEGETER